MTATAQEAVVHSTLAALVQHELVVAVAAQFKYVVVMFVPMSANILNNQLILQISYSNQYTPTIHSNLKFSSTKL